MHTHAHVPHRDRHTLTLTPYPNTITAFTLPPPFLPSPAHWAQQDQPVQSQSQWEEPTVGLVWRESAVESRVVHTTHHSNMQEGLRLAWQPHCQDESYWWTFWSVSTTTEATDEEWQRNSQLAFWDHLPLCPNFTLALYMYECCSPDLPRSIRTSTISHPLEAAVVLRHWPTPDISWCNEYVDGNSIVWNLVVWLTRKRSTVNFMNSSHSNIIILLLCVPLPTLRIRMKICSTKLGFCDSFSSCTIDPSAPHGVWGRGSPPSRTGGEDTVHIRLLKHIYTSYKLTSLTKVHHVID